MRCDKCVEYFSPLYDSMLSSRELLPTVGRGYSLNIIWLLALSLVAYAPLNTCM